MLYDDCVGYGSPISRIDRLHLPHCSSSLSQSQRPSQKRDNSRQSPLRHWPSKARHLGVSPFGPGREANEAVVSGWHGGMVAWWRGQARGLLTVQFVGYVALAAVELPVAEPIVRDAVAAHPASKLALVALGRSGWKTDENQAEYTPPVQ